MIEVPNTLDVMHLDELTVLTVNGAIEISGVNTENYFLAENIFATTTNGRIVMENLLVNGELGIRTTNGGITLTNVHADMDLVDITTRNGRIVVH